MRIGWVLGLCAGLSAVAGCGDDEAPSGSQASNGGSGGAAGHTQLGGAGTGGEAATGGSGVPTTGGSGVLTTGTPCPIPDPVLEEHVRAMIGKEEGEIFVEELDRFTEVDAFMWTQQVEDLSGIQCFSSLETLVMSRSAITDLTPVAALENLTTLTLRSIDDLRDLSPIATMTQLEQLALEGGVNQERDPDILAPIANLTHLVSLDLGSTHTQDLSVVSNLVSLVTLHVDNNLVQDLTPLSTLTGNSFVYLTLSHNEITDVSPLAHLTFEDLSLRGNQITDLTPLVASPSFGIGAVVDLTSNPLNCSNQDTLDAIQTLLDRGVNLTTDCDSS